MKFTISKLTIIAFITIISGCANQPPISIEELKLLQENNLKKSSRFYPSKTPDETLKAAHEVLYLLDPTDMRFDISASNLYASRWWTIYFVLGFDNGRDYYKVTATKVEGGTILTFGLTGGSNGWGTSSDIFKKDIIADAKENPFDLDLFHDRVEYILGLKTDWTTCDMAKIKTKKNMRLCDMIGLENISPKK